MNSHLSFYSIMIPNTSYIKFSFWSWEWEWEWQTARAQCMYACTDPTSNLSITNRCQEEVPYGDNKLELDHRGGCRDSIGVWLTN